MGWPEGKVIGVDIAADHPENINFIIGQCSNFEFQLGDSVEAAKKIYEKYGLIDILFIDTTHTYGRTMAEFWAWHP
jgi:hypothetical protein